MSNKDITPWETILLVIYCHGWEFDATMSRVKKISSKLCVITPDVFIKDLEAWGLVTVYNDKLILTKKGLSNARKICMEYSDLCEEIRNMVWSEVSKQFTTLKRFVRR
jgi:hypothetical protein